MWFLTKFIVDWLPELRRGLERQRPDPTTRILLCVKVAARVFSLFLQIHPYVNGNGHIGRLMLTCVLVEFGYPVGQFPIEPGPKEQAYYQSLIWAQNRGNFVPLEKFILKHFLLPPPKTSGTP